MFGEVKDQETPERANPRTEGRVLLQNRHRDGPQPSDFAKAKESIASTKTRCTKGFLDLLDK